MLKNTWNRSINRDMAETKGVRNHFAACGGPARAAAPLPSPLIAPDRAIDLAHLKK